MQPSAIVARELGPVIQPASSARLGAHGWIGGLQLFAAKDGGWYGLVNASPTPPASIIEEPDLREPAPSLVPIRKVWSMADSQSAPSVRDGKSRVLPEVFG